ncbi:MAG TPA: fibronectin type III domain-containing protein [Solirubrobacterales bacterium]|nr:fibronectin type III domain-containing protein [Solirubrobacterales bacterium]
MAAGLVFFGSPAGALASTVTIEPEGSGSGTVTSSPAGISCAWDGESQTRTGTCSAFFSGFFRVTLSAEAGAGSAFTGWSGLAACEGTESCAFFAQSATTVTAHFSVSLPAPTVTIEPPTDVAGGLASFHGTVDPNGSVTSWRFEYRQVGATEWTSAPIPAGDAGQGTDPEPVETTVEGLLPDASWEVRLQASNQTSSETSAVESFATVGVPPVVVTKAPVSVADTAATLVATVDPRNAPVTSCRLEYGPTDAYGSSVPCGPEPGAGATPVLVSAEVTALSPATTYHFRVVAANECASGCGAETGADATFTTYPAFAFPARGFELVSALDTNGLRVIPALAAPAGGRFAYQEGLVSLPGAENGGSLSAFVATRGHDGSWTQSFVGVPARFGTADNSSPVYDEADLGEAAWSTRNPIAPEDQNGASDVFLADLGNAHIDWLSRDPSLAEGAAQTDSTPCETLVYVGSAGHRVLFECKRALLPADIAPATVPSLYQWADGALSLVGVRPGTDVGFAAGSSLGSSVNRNVGGEPGYANAVTAHAVSRDGTRVVFESGTGKTSQHLYVRLDGRSTVEASGSEGVDPAVSEPRNVEFQGADENDESVFFTSGSALTPDSEAPGTTIDPVTGADGSADLYRYSVPADGDPAHGRLLDLTPAPGGAGIRQVLAVSDDGRRVYFLARAALTADASSAESCFDVEPATPEFPALGGLPGPCNLYLAELGGPAETSVRIHLVTQGTIPVAGYSYNSLAQAFVANPREKAREVAAIPDGSVLAFRSPDDLVPGRRTGGYPQVFAFDADRGELSCVSCPGDGSPATAFADLTPSLPDPSTHYPGTVIATETETSGPHVRNVSEDGTVFFQTAGSLVPGDANGKLDVYAWRAGRVGLISAADAGASYFADASADGSTVFIDSSSRLVPGMPPGVFRIYAARVGGGAASVGASAPCGAGDCREAVAPQSSGQGAASAAFVGPGNPRSSVGKHRRTNRHKAHRRKANRHKRRKAHHGRRGRHRRATDHRGGAK